MTLLAVAPGPAVTFQDGGRFGYRQFGVPVSGPFDRRSAAVANALLGNQIDAAVIELAGFGGIYKAECQLALAVAGAAMAIEIRNDHGNDRRMTKTPCSFNLARGETLHLGPIRKPHGYRSYLAVQGGWNAPLTLGSRSSEQAIRAGDQVAAMKSQTVLRTTNLGMLQVDDASIRYLDGPDVASIEVGTLERQSYRVSADSNRIGIRLEGALIDAVSPESRLSSPVAPGTIQIAGGLPIVLGPACGTMGGYPHVGQVISPDLDRIGQLRPGSMIRFQRVGLQAAREIDRHYRAAVHELWLQLAVACGSL